MDYICSSNYPNTYKTTQKRRCHMENSITEVWKRYELGRSYNSSLVPDQYSLVSTNIEFFSGNQWLNMPETQAMSRLPKPVFNIIKRVTSLFVASLTSSACTITFEALTDGDKESAAAADFATSEVRNLLEKFKMDYRIREALFDGAQTGDYCAHFWWDPQASPYGGMFGSQRGEIRMELVDGINVMFGNPNTPDVESQPYILIIGRASADSLKAEALSYRGKSDDKSDIETIGRDRDYNSYGRAQELEAEDGTGKCLYAYMYRKVKHFTPELTENGVELRESTTVYVTKATKTCVIYEDIDTGLSRYPIAWGNWERQKNQYHGRALVTGIIPNQIFINTMFAMVMRHLQLSGFPKTVYNAALIPQWSSEIGQAIGVKNLAPGQSLSSAAVNLAPSDMSSQIIAAIDKALQYTKECLGATDVQMGNVKPDNTSAILVLQESSEVPLENIRAGLYEWVEDIGAILLDMMGTYYGRRTVVRERELQVPQSGLWDNQPELDPVTGLLKLKTEKSRTAEVFDFSCFKRLWLCCRADVGAANYYSEIATVQTLDNLRREGVLDMLQYLERIPDRLIPRKAELIESLKAYTEDENKAVKLNSITEREL
jgi:hypothetical protein